MNADSNESVRYRLYVVPHTHWDREWYGSFQLFRVRLVRLVNKLLDLLERDPEFRTFTLDGQTSVLDDYLEVHPERREELADLIGSGRLIVGPWYILPDEFLTSGESLVRNLLLGGQMAQDFGGRMEVGYIPDTFGHIAQLPQVLNGFGLDTCMHVRGLDSGVRSGVRSGARRSELWWQAPDGSRVLLHHLSTVIGYGDVGALSDDPRRAAHDLYALAQYKAERATGEVLLAMQGIDHAEARENLAQIIGIAQDTFDDAEFIHATLDEFWAALRQATPLDTLETVTGELRDIPRTAGSMNLLLYSVLSSRADNKLANARTLVALEGWAEPWAVLAALWDVAEYPAGHLAIGWKWLLKNHPHDSIGGCSIDAVHRQMMTRFEWAQEIALYLTEERHRLISNQIDMGNASADEYGVVLFNGTATPRDEVVTVDIDLPVHWLKARALANHPPAPDLTPDSHFLEVLAVNMRADWFRGAPDLPEVFFRSVVVRPDGGEAVPVQIHGITRTTTAIALGSGPHGMLDVYRVRASFRAQIPAYGYATYYVQPDERPSRWQPERRTAPNVLENEHLRIVVHSNGTFDIESKRGFGRLEGLGYLEDSGDNGDGYTFSPPRGNRIVTTLGSAPHIERVGNDVGLQQVSITYRLRLPVGLDATRQQREPQTVECPVVVELLLRQESPRLDLTVHVDNQARNHRLRMVFPTPYAFDEATSGMQFDAQTRPVRPRPVLPDEWWVEDAPETFPMQGWMSVGGEHSGLAILAEGVYEFGTAPAEPGGAVALTLLRAVGILGAHRDLNTRLLEAGPAIPTPEAQLQKKLTYRLALLPHAGEWSDAGVPQQMQAFLAPPVAVEAMPGDGSRPAMQTGIAVEGEGVLSAVKMTEDKEAFLIRVYNPTDQTVITPVQLPRPMVSAAYCRLDETPGEPIAFDDPTRLDVTLQPRKIVSVRLTF